MIRKNKPKIKPEVSTASLPDIIFMLLFFFMVVTVMRQNKLMIKVKIPQASEIQKLEKRSLINYIHIGKPFDKRQGTAAAIQINDAFISTDRVETAILEIRSAAPEHLQSQLISSLKVDEKVHMGIVADVKTALRKANQLKINYEAIAQRE